MLSPSVAADLMVIEKNRKWSMVSPSVAADLMVIEETETGPCMPSPSAASDLMVIENKQKMVHAITSYCSSPHGDKKYQKVVHASS